MAMRKNGLRLAKSIPGLAILLLALGAFSVITAALVTPSASAAQATDWTAYTSPAGHFKASFPTPPSEISITTYTSQPNTDEVYVVSVATFPNSVDLSNSKTILDNVVTGYLKGASLVPGAQGSLISSSHSTFRGYPAVDYKVNYTVNNATVLYSRVKSFLVGHTLYTIANSERTDAFPNFDRFVDSFQVIGQ